MGASQWEEGMKMAERVFEDIMAKNVPNLMKILGTEIQEVQPT